MESSRKKASWVYLVLLGVLAFVLSIVVVTVVVTGYAAVLAFQVRGAPDTQAIDSFAGNFSNMGANAALWLSALAVAYFGIRRRPGSALWAGLVVGAVAGLPDIVMSGGLAIDGVLLFLVTAVAGFVGGWLGLRSSAAAPAMVEPVEVPPPQA